jgi:hypothetical protein
MQVIDAIAIADSHLNHVGLTSYTEVLAMLLEVQRLALDLECGNAYISKSYVNEQNKLNKRIDALIKSTESI